MAPKGKSITVLHFNEHTISLLRAQRSGDGIKVVDWQETRGPWARDDGTLQEALAKFSENHGLAKEAVYSVLPRHEITVRLLELPSQDENELHDMLVLTAEEYVPYSVKELVMDMAVVAKLPSGSARILAAFAHKDVVQAHLAMLHGAGIRPADVFLSTACLAAAAGATEASEEKKAVANIEPDGLEVIVLTQGEVIYGRGVGHGQGFISTPGADEDVTEELTGEMRSSLAAYRRESVDGEPVDGIWVCSNSIDVNEIGNRLQGELGIDCAVAPIAEGWVKDGRERLGHTAYVSLGAAALALETTPGRVSLLPKADSDERKRTRLQSRLSKATVVALVILAGCAGLFGIRTYQYDVYIRELERRAAVIEPEVRGVAAMQKQLATLNRQVASAGTALELFAWFCSVAPDKELNVTRFSYHRDNGLTIEGRALQLAVIDKLTEDLRALGDTAMAQFARARQIYTQNQVERGQRVIEFSIGASFSDEEDENE